MSKVGSVVAKDLSVEKSKKQILNAVSFSLQPGKLIGLIGPSGSGKTTLMRSIVGVQKLTSGSLEVLSRPSGSRQLRSRIGYVTQSPAIYDDLTVIQNLMYFKVLVNANKKKVEEVLRIVRLDEQKDQLASSLSGGQRARVSLAVALLGDPDILVLDEPTVGLDPLLRKELWDVFSSLAAKGKTVIVSSHVMDEAERCDELLLLRDGRLLWHGALDELLKTTKTSNIEAAFIVMIKKEEKV
ncbi:MAG TPA: ABC transporter ATP-binding protein [Candidatus Saccharimonadales bacterium]